jgi:hypothetical protein
MNVYTCWHQGNLGYGVRTKAKRWMFVPEIGQPDNHIYKDLNLDNLIFVNPLDKRFEIMLEEESDKFSLLRLLKSLIIKSNKPRTVAGLLFTPYL